MCLLLTRLNLQDPVGQLLPVASFLSNVLQEAPVCRLYFVHGKEVEQDHVIELKSLRLVDSQAEHALHELGQLLLNSLFTDDDYLTRSEVGRDRAIDGSALAFPSRISITFIVVFDHGKVLLDGFSLLDGLSEEELAEELISDWIDNYRLLTVFLRDFLCHLIDRFREDRLNELDDIVS